MEAFWNRYSLEVVLKVRLWMQWDVLWLRDHKVEENPGGEQSKNHLEYPDAEYRIQKKNI